MKIRHLRIFKTVCEEESITKASEKLFMTQPAVSHAISELEDYLGVSLFDRISRKVYLNETGKLFLTKVIKLLDLYDDLDKNIRDLEDNAVIKIGSCITIANLILPTIIKKFQGICKSTPTKIIVDNARSIENMLCKNEIDLGLIEGVVYNEELEKIPFSSYELVIACSNKHKFAKVKSIDLSELMNEKLLLREKGSSIRDLFDSALLLHDIKINPSWTSVNSQVLIEAAKDDLGVTVLPKVLLENEINLGNLVEVKVKGLNLSNINHIVFYKGKVQTKSFKELVNIIRMFSYRS